MKRYRKKPVVIEAITWNGDPSRLGLLTSLDESIKYHADRGLEIVTLEGTMTVSIGDYIIKGIQGEFYPCKPDIFFATYEIVEDTCSTSPHSTT